MASMYFCSFLSSPPSPPQDEEVIVMPNEGEVRMLTDPLVLEVMLAGRAKAATLPLVRMHSEQLQCVLRLSRVSALSAPRCGLTAHRKLDPSWPLQPVSTARVFVFLPHLFIFSLIFFLPPTSTGGP